MMNRQPKIFLASLSPGYARIILALQRRSGLTREEIAQQAYVAITTLSGGGYLRHMKELGLIHISGWRRNSAGAFSVPQYSAGRSKDYPRPRMTPDRRDAPGMRRLLEAIERYGPVDYREAARLSGLSPNTVKSAGYLKALMVQRMIFVADWRRSRNGPPNPLYDAGTGRPAPPPVPASAAEKSRHHRARKKSIAKSTGSLAAQIGLTSQALRTSSTGLAPKSARSR